MKKQSVKHDSSCVLGKSIQDADDIFDDEQPDRDNLGATAPVLKDVWGRHGNIVLVGQEKATNEFCGKLIRLKGCLRVDLHNRVTLDGKNFAGKVVVRRVFCFCMKPSCIICFKRGWAMRESGNIVARLTENGKFKGCFGRFGQIEHVVCSLPVSDYHLSVKAQRRKATKILKKRGVIGGCLIYHGFRYRKFMGWYYSPHFHSLCFIFGGYSKCRNCPRKSNCDPACKGFDARAWKLFNEDGYYVKVMGRRKTIFGTSWYQLSHSSYEIGGKRHVVVTWFGCCSYRKLKVTKELRQEFCTLCSSELVEIVYTGSKRLHLCKGNSSFEGLKENGVSVFAEKVKPVAVARIAKADYFSFPEGLGLYSDRRKFDADFEAQKKWADRRVKIVESEVWHGGLPKRQFEGVF